MHRVLVKFSKTSFFAMCSPNLSFLFSIINNHFVALNFLQLPHLSYVLSLIFTAFICDTHVEMEVAVLFRSPVFLFDKPADSSFSSSVFKRCGMCSKGVDEEVLRIKCQQNRK